MRRIGKYIISIIFGFMVVLFLASCGDDSKKLPGDSAYEKVSFAFDGVEESFKNSSNLNSLDKSFNINDTFLKAINKKTFASLDDGLSTIEDVYVDEDNEGNILDEDLYYEPPMIQFQCLKNIFDKTGEDYTFDSKNEGTITGNLYLDIDSGLEYDSTEADAEEHKYSYEFVFAISITIDDNDVIDSDVLFDITVKNDSEEYNIQMYVHMNLVYDMTDTDPNYKMTMYTNDDNGMPYRDGYTYEYDYVDVKDGEIEEWRKFDLESNIKLVKDSSHTTFSSYLGDELDYKVGTCKWYKDNNLRRIEQMTDAKKQILAEAFFSDIKLNSTDINGDDFINSEAIQNKAIKTVYSDASKNIGKDLAIDLVCNEEDLDTTPTSMAVYKHSDGSEWGPEMIYENGTIGEFFTNDQLWGGTIGCPGYPDIYYLNSDNNKIRKIEYSEFDNFNFELKSFAKSGSDLITNTATVSLDDDFVTVLASELGGYDVLNENSVVTLTITSKSDSSFTCVISIILHNSILFALEEIKGTEFPKELLEMGIPEYETEGSFSFESNEKETVLTVTSNELEFNNYINKLVSNGFYLVAEYTKTYAKVINGKILNLTLSDTTRIKIEILSDDYLLNWPTIPIANILGNSITLPAIGNGYFYLSTESGSEYIYVYGLTSAERNAYLEAIDTISNAIVLDNQIVIIYDNKAYSINYNLNDNGRLYIELNLYKNGTSNGYYIGINGVYSLLSSKQPGDFEKSISLEENDVVTLTFDKTINNEAFIYEPTTKSYTVSVAGTYTFSYTMDKDQFTVTSNSSGTGTGTGTETENLIFSIVGDFNNWETSVATIDFSLVETGKYQVETTFDTSYGAKFKIISNHSWDNGGYGYSNISNIANYSRYFSLDTYDDNNNVLILQNCTVILTITVQDNNELLIAIDSVS
ncbi:MAG: hypothetical protein K6A63_06540 [Acholeplasmatales bacterium]|nr:hypothetical protein [Acholeplasmatales bacterium]